jgi:hypothetical protein
MQLLPSCYQLASSNFLIQSSKFNYIMIAPSSKGVLICPAATAQSWMSCLKSKQMIDLKKKSRRPMNLWLMPTEIGLRNLQNNSKVITGFQHCSKIKTSESYQTDANNVGDSWPDGFMDKILD